MREPHGPEHLEFWQRRLKGADRRFVYVMQPEGASAVKIGKALDPRERLATAQTFNPVPIHLLYVIPGYTEMEGAFHRMNHQHRRTGEWFDLPGVSDFLSWLHDYCLAERDYYWKTGELPRVPASPLPKSKYRPGLVSQGAPSARMGHRWRTSDGVQHPVVVRFEKPAPKTPDEVAQKLADAAQAGLNAYEIAQLERELRAA
jgi:hypothetical protein